MKNLLFIALFVLASCAVNSGIHFNLIGDVTSPFEHLEENVKTVLQSDCFKKNLNNFPSEVAHLRASSFTIDVKLFEDMDVVGRARTTEIQLNKQIITSPAIAVGITLHELAHVIGYDHPGKFLSDEYESSFVNQAGRVGVECAEGVVK